MTEKPRKLSNTARALLTAAAVRDDYLIRPPQLPAAAARQVVRSLLNAGLAEEIPAPIDDAGYVWRQGDGGSDLMLRATGRGLACLRDGEAGALVPVAAQTEIQCGVDADGAIFVEQPVIRDTPIDEPQAGLEAADAHGSPWLPRPLPKSPTPSRRRRRCRGDQHARPAFGRPLGRCWRPGMPTPPRTPWMSTLPPYALPWLGSLRHPHRPMIHAHRGIRSAPRCWPC
jgi:hypothetical protein